MTPLTLLLLSLLTPSATATAADPITLHPIRSLRPDNPLARRAALSLQTSSTFQWLSRTGTLANLDLSLSSSNQALVNLELMHDLITSMECPCEGAGQMNVTFAERADFNNAEDIWEWVNGEENSFLLVVAAGMCGAGERVRERRVWNVTGVAYDDGRETAMLEVEEVGWGVGRWDLTMGKVDGALRRRLARRGVGIGEWFDRLERGQVKRRFFDKVSEFLGDVVDTVREEVPKIPDKIEEFLGGVPSQTEDLLGDVGDVITELPAKASAVVGDIGDVVGGLPGAIIDVIEQLPDQATDFIEAIPIQVEEVAEDLINGELPTPDFVIPLDLEFNDKTLDAQDEAGVAANCTECFTKGSLDISARFRANGLALEEAWIDVSTPGITARAIIGLGLEGKATDDLFERGIDIFESSPAPFLIPGLLTIGPVVKVRMGVEVSEVNGAVTLLMGGTTTIPKSSARINLLSKEGSTSEGWTPEFAPEPFDADASVETKFTAFIRPSIGMEISLADIGMSAEIFANTPGLTAALKPATSTSCDICGTSKSGLQGDLSLGVSVGASVRSLGRLGDSDTLFSVGFASVDFPIAGFCQPFGPQGDKCVQEESP